MLYVRNATNASRTYAQLTLHIEATVRSISVKTTAYSRIETGWRKDTRTLFPRTHLSPSRILSFTHSCWISRTNRWFCAVAVNPRTHARVTHFSRRKPKRRSRDRGERDALKDRLYLFGFNEEQAASAWSREDPRPMRSLSLSLCVCVARAVRIK